jgi:hypothetical protein
VLIVGNMKRFLISLELSKPHSTSLKEDLPTWHVGFGNHTFRLTDRLQMLPVPVSSAFHVVSYNPHLDNRYSVRHGGTSILATRSIR